MSVELAFSRTLSPKQRRIVHLVAQKLGVYHYPVRKGDERYAVVTRIDPEKRQLGNHRGLQRVSSYLWRRHHCITLRLTVCAARFDRWARYSLRMHTLTHRGCTRYMGHVRTALHCLA
ncbi:hypothetical protein BGY98DRAFT_957254 [Russula aff. rugulosa BPL654]|nr:hypothetical protein BGY98DRAFT_1029084 [Russula aff. rugulosa BPL654]KAI0282022.1 hypothetical protein BGY98DRAFT_957254 [Russula aff. rugulosa BPL654]